jgi:glutaredoxin
MSVLDRVRAAGWRALAGDGAVAQKARALNERLGRPLASPEELADRQAFAAGYTATTARAPTGPAPAAREPAPVIVYFLEKQKRDVPRLTEILDTQHIPYKTMSLEDDPAAQAAVRRDSGGYRLPVVFIAGDCVGGRVELVNLAASGELKKKVFG